MTVLASACRDAGPEKARVAIRIGDGAALAVEHHDGALIG
jgi:hypothetical protein